MGSYGLIVKFVGGPGVRSGSASRANSHSSERVLRGSIISSTQKRLGRAERRAQLVEALLDLLQFCLGIVRGVDVGAVGRLDAAFQRQRAPIGRRPGVTHREAVGRLMHDAGDAEGVAHDDGAPGHRGLVDRGHRAHAVTDGRRLLGLEPDHEAGAIHQIDHRQMEGLGEIDEAHHLLARFRRPRAAVMKGIAGQEHHGAAVEPREAGDDRAAEIRAHLEERALVDHRVDDRPHLVDLAAVARHRLHQRLVRALRIVVASVVGGRSNTDDGR